MPLLSESKEQPSEILVNEALCNLIEQEEQSENYHHYQVDFNTFWVQRIRLSPILKNPVIPLHERTRIVSIIKSGQTKRLHYSCKHYSCHQRTCCHIHAVHSSPLSFHDFGLVNAKMHYALYGKLQSFTHCVNEQASNWIGPIMQDGHTPFMARSLQKTKIGSHQHCQVRYRFIRSTS